MASKNKRVKKSRKKRVYRKKKGILSGLNKRGKKGFRTSKGIGEMFGT